MDILTAKGQQSAKDEIDAIKIWLNKYPEYKYIHTNKKRESAIDGFIVKDDQICAAVETKCRYGLTLDKFLNEYEGMWLITFEKLIIARSVAKKLCTPLIGFLYLVDDKTLLFKKIIDSEGEFDCDLLVKKTITQKTINDKRQVVRNNSFINMNNAKIIK